METKHTPGPWELSTIPFEIRNTDSAAAIYGPMSEQGGSPLIADVSRSAGDGQASANAKLIAAAPEMLEALKEINEWLFVNYPEHGGINEFGTCPTFNKVRSAIKKATE